ncbi:MAG: cyclohexanone monooxygenase [Candidatus Azotimanducaceae bacterium]|jgi:cyclohexanone monooxygenase
MVPEKDQKFDVIIVGAGFAGMYMLHRLRTLKLKVKVIEAATDVGGTWYWNRYPGARCDIPSMEYSFSFSDDLQQEWDWTEVMAAQPEILNYAGEVADRFSLRSDIQFETRVSSVSYQDDNKLWHLQTESGEQFEATVCIMATGCLSVPNTPEIAGADQFKGNTYHTGAWPHEGVNFEGRTVGIIGTGSSGTQSIPIIAEEAKHLTVFQRTPNYTMPAHNEPLSESFQNDAKLNYDDIREQQRQSMVGIIGFGYGFGGAVSEEPTDSILDTTEDERKKMVEEQGFDSIQNFMDIGLDMKANELACEMYRQQVGKVVKDEATAKSLMPNNYPIGCKRPVIDTGYYDTFNRDNVTLVDLRVGGIDTITESGIQTQNGNYEFDDLIFATGFDAMTGALLRMNITGRNGLSLNDVWEDGPRSYLGLQVHGFPNLFTITGPGSPSVLSNMMVSIEQHVDWIFDCISYMKLNDLSTIEASEKAQTEWVSHVNEVAQGTMLTAPSCNSWYLGANIPGKPRIFMPYVAGVGVYREKCDAIASNRYEGFELA